MYTLGNTTPDGKLVSHHVSHHVYHSNPEGFPPMSVRHGPREQFGGNCPLHCSRQDSRSTRSADGRGMAFAGIVGVILAGVVLPIVMRWPN
jgi:hypothetical protein